MYKYKIEDCDVINKARLNNFREKRLKWLDWLGGKDYHSILGQIHYIVWYDAIFRLINKIREIASKQNCNDVGINYDITRLIDSGYVTLMTTAIRRLIEKPKNDPRLAVVSLRRVITDIKENRNIITREIYVGYDGLPYDAEFARLKWFENNPLNNKVRGGWLETKGPKAWHTSEIVHSNFDKLSNKLPDACSREDLIEKRIFDSMDNKLNKCHDIKKYVDKFIAHAADKTHELI